MMTIINRLSAPTPKFWKTTQIICLIISIVIAYLMKNHVGPQSLLLIAAGIFGGCATLAQFAAEDTALFSTLVAHPGEILNVAPELASQIDAIHKAVTNPQPIKVSDIASITTETTLKVSPEPAPTPVQLTPPVDAVDVPTKEPVVVNVRPLEQ